MPLRDTKNILYFLDTDLTCPCIYAIILYCKVGDNMSGISKNAEIILNKINYVKKPNYGIIVAIDGECASGKTTIATEISKNLVCSVIHMDDFFLRPEMRTPEREAEPGGNVDYKRVLNEVIIPLSNNMPAVFRPYDCKNMRMGEIKKVLPSAVNIIEGAYSCHPTLQSFYDLKIFVCAEKKIRLERIKNRNGYNSLKIFEDKWIPMEELYFNTFNIKKQCDLVVEN